MFIEIAYFSWKNVTTLCAQAIPFAEGRYMLLPSPLIFLKVAHIVFLISFVTPSLSQVGLQVLCS